MPQIRPGSLTLDQAQNKQPAGAGHPTAASSSQVGVSLMIRRASERVHTTKKMFGAPGELEAFQILNPGEFNDKGRLFNHCVLRQIK